MRCQWMAWQFDPHGVRPGSVLIDPLNMPSPPIQVFLTTIASQPILRKRQGQSLQLDRWAMVESHNLNIVMASFSQNTSCAFYKPRRSRSLLTTWRQTKTPNACGRERHHSVRDVAHDDGRRLDDSDLAHWQISSSCPVYSSGAGTQVCVDLSRRPS